MSKEASEHDYRNALWNIINLAPHNGHRPADLLQDIHNDLEARINRIESLHNKSIESKKIILSLSCFTLGIASSYVLYHFYQKHYCIPKSEHCAIKKSLEDRGIKVLNNSGSYLYIPLGASNYKNAQRKLIELSEALDTTASLLLLGSTILYQCFFME